MIGQTCNFAVRPESNRRLADDYWPRIVIRTSDSVHTGPAGIVPAVEHGRTNECTGHAHDHVIL